MLQAILATIRDLGAPGVGNPHHRATTFIGHAMISAAIVEPLGWSGMIPALVIAALYARFKERRDFLSGGGLWDSAEDTIGVAMGAFYGTDGWPAYVLATALGIMVLARLK